ncbi:MAG: putative sugar O-methyltransferase [Nitrospiraceae bacterium]|nr:MAG: putative sugar O-methyltransferase [Nitrospiraceae bacterium]
MSSHWRVYSQGAQVEIDEEGHLLNLRGEGFGGYQDERMLKRLADYVCCAIHFLRAEEKQEIVRLTKIAFALIKRIPFGHHYLSYDLFRQVVALATINRHFRPRGDEKFNILVIGDGFGFLAALIKSVYPSASVLLADIGRTLFFQCLYLQVLHPQCSHVVMGSDGGNRPGLPDVDFLYCQTEHLETIEDCRLHLVINVCSMQEMTTTAIARHFRYIRKHAEAGAMFYCCNRESKVLPGGEKVEFEAYPWLPTDRHLIDGYPLVYRFWFSSRVNGNGPKLCGVTVPFVDGPDGPVRHRLTVLSKLQAGR